MSVSCVTNTLSPTTFDPSTIIVFLKAELDELKEECSGASTSSLFQRYVTELSTLCSVASTPSSSFTALDSIREDCWTTLHAHPSPVGPMSFRRIYERAGMLLALRTLRRTDSSTNDSSALSPLSHALRALDLGLMIGSDDTRFNQLVQMVVGEIEKRMEILGSMEPVTTSNVFANPLKRAREVDSTEQLEYQSERKQPRVGADDGAAAASSRDARSIQQQAPSHVPILPTSSFASDISRVHLPSLTAFHHSFLTPGKPCVLTGVIAGWPAMEKWQDLSSYFIRTCGRRTVPVEIGNSYTEKEWSQELWTVETFVKEIEKREVQKTQADASSSLQSSQSPQPPPSTPLPKTIYLAQHSLFSQVPALRRDLVTPDYVLLGGGGSSSSAVGAEPEVKIWLGPSGTISPLHHDPTHGFLCQVKGRKYVRLYGKEYQTELYPNQPPLANTSGVEIESINAAKHPLAVSLPYQECILSPGEMLFIPRDMWHYVRSLDVSASVSFWWE